MFGKKQQQINIKTEEKTSPSHTTSTKTPHQNQKSPTPPPKKQQSSKSSSSGISDMLIGNPKKQRILASTQDHLDIYDIKDDVILLKTGDVSLVIETTAVNFQLLSSFEQDLKIKAFTELINSLNFQLQIVIHTEPIDMRKYIYYLKDNYKKLQHEMLRENMKAYMDFVKELVVQNNVLQKRFFVIIPHNSGVITADQVNPMQKMVDFVIGRKRVVEIKNADELIEKAKTKLIPKRDHIMKLLSRMGLGSKQLNNQELTNLFYSYYNNVTSY